MLGSQRLSESPRTALLFPGTDLAGHLKVRGQCYLLVESGRTQTRRHATAFDREVQCDWLAHVDRCRLRLRLDFELADPAVEARWPPRCGKFKHVQAGPVGRNREGLHDGPTSERTGKDASAEKVVKEAAGPTLPGPRRIEGDGRRGDLDLACIFRDEQFSESQHRVIPAVELSLALARNGCAVAEADFHDVIPALAAQGRVRR